MQEADHGSARQDRDGEDIGVLAARIRELEGQIASLRATERIHRIIIETAEDCIFCKDARRRYALVNPAMEPRNSRPRVRGNGKDPAPGCG